MPVNYYYWALLYTNIKARVSSIWAKGCMFYDCVCVVWLDMTTPPWWREKVMVYYFINI